MRPLAHVPKAIFCCPARCDDARDQGHRHDELISSGSGVPRDYVQAYMWFDLSSEGSQDFSAAASRSAVADKMTPAQIAEGQKLASAWRLKRPDQR
jgi:hypothetical protein